MLLEKPATRIIALYGAYNELLLALGAGDLLVARTVADARLPQLAELADLSVIGTHMRPNAELIVGQKPDLVLQLSGRKEARLQTEALRKLGINVLTFEMNSFERMFDVLGKIALLTGREQQAAALIRGWRGRLAALRARHAGQRPVRVFYEVRYPNLLAAGKGSIVDEIIAYAGGANVVREEKKLVRINEEALIQADPDVYLLQKGPMNPDPEPLERRAHYRELRAARAGRVLVVDEDRFARPGPRAVDAAEELERWLHPQAR
ncbi:ABC transporter substrate-binding protein [Desulfovibrio sp. ZJ369]|uniref:ABC transporter substrate-binding protein n=1 Tax=Desulfovibrio sp. ZJ369 TaxID=2709793 RepID=UPI001F155486|nr:ABC transporter substrate-binding protein [Desulfovibrio sp. ZJ369]